MSLTIYSLSRRVEECVWKAFPLSGKFCANGYSPFCCRVCFFNRLFFSRDFLSFFSLFFLCSSLFPQPFHGPFLLVSLFHDNKTSIWWFCFSGCLLSCPECVFLQPATCVCVCPLVDFVGLTPDGLTPDAASKEKQSRGKQPQLRTTWVRLKRPNSRGITDEFLEKKPSFIWIEMWENCANILMKGIDRESNRKRFAPDSCDENLFISQAHWYRDYRSS